MMLRQRGLAAVLLGVLACTESDALHPGQQGDFGLRPAYPAYFSRFATQLAITNVRLQVRSLAAGTVLVNQVTPFDLNDATLTLSARVPLVQAESVAVDLFYLDQSGTVIYSGTQDLLMGPGAPPPAVSIPVTYSGVGNNTYYIYLTPSADTVVTVGDQLPLQVDAYDTTGAPVPSVYIAWFSDDPSVPVNAAGVVHAPSPGRIALITAATPNGTFGTRIIQTSSSNIAIGPDSLEVQPGQQVYFRSLGNFNFTTTRWTVNGIVGGDSTVGLVDSLYGYFSAPLSIAGPMISTVCANDAGNSACSPVSITTPPTPGGDLVVLSDVSMLGNASLSGNPDNRRLARQLVNYSINATRGSVHKVVWDRGRGSNCLANGTCNDAALTQLETELNAAGYSVSRQDKPDPIKSVAPDVKVYFVWAPGQYYSQNDVNAFKRFAKEGGRIVLVSDDTLSFGGTTSGAFYSSGGLMSSLGTSGYINAIDVDCPGPVNLGPTDFAPHQVTAGLTSLTYACAADIATFAGSGSGYPIAGGRSGIIGWVGKIDTYPGSGGQGLRAAARAGVPIRRNGR